MQEITVLRRRWKCCIPEIWTCVSSQTINGLSLRPSAERRNHSFQIHMCYSYSSYLVLCLLQTIMIETYVKTVKCVQMFLPSNFCHRLLFTILWLKVWWLQFCGPSKLAALCGRIVSVAQCPTLSTFLVYNIAINVLLGTLQFCSLMIFANY